MDTCDCEGHVFSRTCQTSYRATENRNDAQLFSPEIRMMNSMSINPHPTGDVIVIGAGIVGVCTAWNIARRGLKVTLIDQDEPGKGCSFGNAGAISFGSVAPLAMPGVLKDAIGMLFNPDAPLRIPLTYLPKAAPWLRQFVAAADRNEVERLARALATILAHAMEKHQELSRDVGAPQLIRRSGQLYVYPSEKSLGKDAMSWRLRTEHGLKVQRVDQGDIAELEPAVGPNYRFGYLTPDQGMSVEPYKLVVAVARDFVRQGGTLARDRVEEILLEGDRAAGVRTAHTQYAADHVVVCAGAWSMRLLSRLGYAIPLESQRGYHVMVPEPGVTVHRPVIAADRKVFFTPMEGGLRVAGTVEFGGLEKAPTRRRADVLVSHIRKVFPKAHEPASREYWMGHRPCLPDSLPVLGPSRHKGLWFNFGHGHLGLTMSATSGEIIAREIVGDRSNVDLAPFRADRFEG
jgi:glycine/D-amino acid oxidase-like deaminating enzyme